MASPYAQFGPRLVDLGYAAVPCMPNDKIPADYMAGNWVAMPRWSSRYSTNLPSKYQVKSWSEKPLAGICLICGRASQYVVGIDVDVDDAVEDVKNCLPHTDVVKKGQKGATFFFRSKTIPATSFNGTTFDGRILRLVDVLSEGRQTVLPPSIHPKTGLPYRWIGKYALDEIEPDDLPELPDNALELIAGVLLDHGYNPDVMPHSHALNVAARAGDPRFKNFDDSSHYKMLNDAAWECVDKWITTLNLFKLTKTRAGYEAVGTWAQSGTGKPDEQREPNLKINVHKHTIVDFGDGNKGYSPINLVRAARPCTTEEAYRYLADIVYGPAPDFSDLMATEPAPEQEMVEPKREVAKPSMDITKAPGLLGLIANHIVLSSMHQQPLFAMGAALAIMSVLTGRQYKGPTKTSTALYQIEACPTGYGKQGAFDGINAILVACGLDNHLGPGEFSSDVAIFSALIRQPNMLCCIDECAGLIGRGSSRNSAAYEMGIPAQIRSIYSHGFKLYKTKESAARMSQDIWWPNFSIFGASTTDELYSRLSSAEVTNGLLNRFIVLRNDQEPVMAEPQIEACDVSAEITEWAKAIYHNDGLSSASFHGDGSTKVDVPAVNVEFADDEARALWKDIQARGMKLTREKSPLFVRCAENTVRVATNRAVSINWRNPAVTVEDLAWSAEYVFSAAESMLIDTEDKISENTFEADTNKVIGIIKKHGGNTTRTRLIRSAKMPARRLQEVTDALRDGGRIGEAVMAQTNGPGLRMYKLLS